MLKPPTSDEKTKPKQKKSTKVSNSQTATETDLKTATVNDQNQAPTGSKKKKKKVKKHLTATETDTETKTDAKTMNEKVVDIFARLKAEHGTYRPDYVTWLHGMEQEWRDSHGEFFGVPREVILGFLEYWSAPRGESNAKLLKHLLPDTWRIVRDSPSGLLGSLGLLGISRSVR